MALKKTMIKYIYGQDITFENTYSKITEIAGSKDNLRFTLITYNEGQTDIIETNNFVFVPSVEDTALNFIKQGYEYLKTLDEYKDAVDVLDEGQTA